jgi:hypothetical protein
MLRAGLPKQSLRSRFKSRGIAYGLTAPRRLLEVDVPRLRAQGGADRGYDTADEEQRRRCSVR